jgi:hypothetical protein
MAVAGDGPQRPMTQQTLPRVSQSYKDWVFETFEGKVHVDRPLGVKQVKKDLGRSVIHR